MSGGRQQPPIQRRKRRERMFQMVERVRERNKNVKPEVIEREIEQAIAAVRGKARRRRR